MQERLQQRITSSEETKQLAEKIGRHLAGGEVITLTGDLGAGKTTFTQGLAKGLGVKRHVNSPTFTIIKEYQGSSLTLYHMDAYRLEDQAEDLGFDEYFYGGGVCVVEWPQMIQDYIPQERLEIEINKTGEQTREISFTPRGERYEQLIKEVLA